MDTDASKPRRMVEVPLIAGFTTLVPGLVALATHTILLFPSLGPTALMQAHSPQHKTSRIYNVVAGHVVGLFSAFVFVWVFGLTHTPSVFEVRSVSAARVWATVLAIVLAALLEIVLDAVHPPAASTTLLASLGSFKPNVGDTARVIAGVLIVAITGELIRRYRASQHVSRTVANHNVR